MKQTVKQLIMPYLLSLLTACSHSLYQGKLDVTNSDGKAQQAVVYWTKTEQLLGTDKAGPIILMTGCSTRRPNFVDSPTGIVFRGTPGLDQRTGQSDPQTDDILCGKINNAANILDLKAEPLLVSIYCTAQRDEMSIPDPLHSPAYIQARKAPYQFEVEESSHWSMFGDIPEAPQPPECR